MIFLCAAILISSSLFVIFKFFTRFRINTFQAITFNYLIASIFGFSLFTPNESIITLFSESWFYLAVIEGILFIAVFVLFGISSQKAGVAVTAVASKMSVVIPIIAGIMIYNDSVIFSKIAGIVFALLAFYLSTRKNKDTPTLPKFAFLPLLLFIGNGFVDALIKVAEHFYLYDDKGYFASVIFLTALIIGGTITTYKVIVHKEKIQLRNFIGGSILGIFNFSTTYFKILALAFMESSRMFPILNAGIVSLTALLGVIIFKEKLSLTNWIGILLSVVAIILISINR